MYEKVKGSPHFHKENCGFPCFSKLGSIQKVKDIGTQSTGKGNKRFDDWEWAYIDQQPVPPHPTQGLIVGVRDDKMIFIDRHRAALYNTAIRVIQGQGQIRLAICVQGHQNKLEKPVAEAVIDSAHVDICDIRFPIRTLVRLSPRQASIG